MNDLSLLRKYEPIVYFSQGEMFFPTAVDEYIKRCSLWLRDNDGNERQVVAAGRLTVESLGHFNAPPPNHTYYLQFVQEPLNPTEYRQWWQDPRRPTFQAAGRLSRVSLASRLIDSLFDLSLVVRGTVPGGTAASAELMMREIEKVDNRRVYYGRVVRDGGYIVLHYLFFYVMNNWRSGFYGVNDHEADWEQVFVFLSDEGENDPKPRWVAYASHDFKGDDLRRRWDDRELKRDGDHPIIFAGAGSHASYFSRGEYLMGVAPAFLKPVGQSIEKIQKFWVEQLGQGNEPIAEKVQALLRVPFVDYARGDGIKIGPKQQQQWSPELITEKETWLHRYRGLWGLDTRDFIGGERAPGGAKFNRDGSVRQSWADPLGWAGLDKVPPPRETAFTIRDQIANIEQKQVQLKQMYRLFREKVRVLFLETAAFAQTDYYSPLMEEKKAELDSQQQALQTIRKEQYELQETQAALSRYLLKIEAGDWGNPRAHISHTHEPEPPLPLGRRLLDIWAALSSGLLVLALLVFLSVPLLRQIWFVGIGVVTAAFIAIEAILEGRMVKLLLNITIWLAILSVIILIYRYWFVGVILGLAFFAIIMLRENLRELRM